MKGLARSLIAILLLVLAVGAIPVAAQTPALDAARAATETAPAVGSASEAELRALVETLQDEAARGKLVAQLNALIAARAAVEKPPAPSGAGARIMTALSERIDEISTAIVAGARVLLDAPALIGWLATQWRDSAARALWIGTIWKVALVLAIGLLGEWIVRLALGRPRRALEARESANLWLRIPVLIARTIVDVLPIAGFAAVGFTVLSLVEPGEVTRVVALALINASVLARAIVAVARMALTPAAADLRLFPISDLNANYSFIWIRRLTNVSVYGYFLAQVALLLGLAPGAAAALLKTVGLLVALMLVVLAMQNRAAVAQALRGGRGGQGPAALGMVRERFADTWHILAILYVVAVYGIWAIEVEGGFELMFLGTMLSIVILVAARLAAGGLRRVLRRGFALGEQVQRQFPGLDARANRYLPIMERVGVAVIYIIAAFSLLEAWQMDAFGWIGSDFGQRVTGSALTVAGLLIAAVLFWEMVSSTIERYLEAEREDAAQVSARARTLLPMLRTAILVVMVAVVGIFILSEIGVNIAPLLAGAGVVGLAVGFGSQALVKDVITGVFILMEDQMAVGDVVKLGSHAGVVEDISLRTIRLRDLGGNVHIIPFGEVTTVENMTKEFSRYIFNVGVAYREDTDQVVAALKQIGEDLQQDEEYGPMILEPLEVLGVDSFDDSAVIIKARITTQPIKQWAVGREFNRRMKKRFDELGIEIPFPHSTIYFGEDKEGRAPPAFVQLQDAKDSAKRREAPSAPETETAPPMGRARVRRDAGLDGDADGGGGGEDS